MTNVPRYRTFVPSVSLMVPKTIHVEFKQFKFGSGTVIKPEVPDPNRFQHESSPEIDQDLELSDSSWQSDDEAPANDISTQVIISDEEDDEQIKASLRLGYFVEEDQKEADSNTTKEGANVVMEMIEKDSEEAVSIDINALISLHQLGDNGTSENAAPRPSSTDSLWSVPEDDTRDLLEMQIWRREFDLCETEKPLVQSSAENVKLFVLDYLKSFICLEKALHPEREIMIEQLTLNLSQLLKYDIQNHRREKKEVDLDVFVLRLKEYMMTAVSYRARKLRRASVVGADKSSAEAALSIALLDELADAVERRYDRLYRISKPDLGEDELQGIQLAISEVKKLLRGALQSKVSLEHQALRSRDIVEHFEEIDKLTEVLIRTVFQDTDPTQRTGGLLLECTYELVDIIVKKLTPAHGKTREEIIEEFVSHALHILSQELNKRGITV